MTPFVVNCETFCHLIPAIDVAGNETCIGERTVKEPKTLDEALQSLFATIEKEKRAAIPAKAEEGRTAAQVGREGGGNTALVIDFAQWKKKRTARL